ncbi:TlpA family protein disulfide reductase [Dyadobacter arcticus]|uniref:Cytochrome oxidase Cu insertion factor (SCO1/SenC/PrrC family) n=1 Tax=Dyadobacter arcticus TaxID=1078754 RepID=A0ABX0UM50_9BACT|nr:thioredoxin-like domain-containing protein [Dyadobacter arcticus]NIJ53982.1 cytochrome oxidase Cu insertion factor (SCO1/SenC/PrrC family) [Dyadobacter arcticus]
MRISKIEIFISLIFTILTLNANCQSSEEKVTRYNGKISQQFVINRETIIIEHATGKRISYETYDQILRSNPGVFKTQPIFDKYGKPSSFELIKRSQLQIQDNGSVMHNADLMPEVGEPLPPFVMKGLDGKEYISEKLKGKYILLGFWVKYEKPLYTFASTKVISSFIEENKHRGVEIVSLGTTLNTEEECMEAIPKRNCGFIPVPESYGFNHRYKISETPYFILVDKKGIIKAMASHTEFSQISELMLR